ncbi:MAG TPA: hypothetical protein VF669_18945 [Tepidisphaeraceae bacterium]|jgi:hypothetical protein
MRRLSSIFSFSTLRAPRRVPKALLLTVALLAMAAAGAQVAVRRGLLKPDPSLHSLIGGYRSDLKAHDYDVWMLGNSMLEWGVDPAEFEKLTGEKCVVLAHGSSTPRASVVLLRYYLRNTRHRPKSVLLFCAEDDTNRNGIRAEESQRYLDYIERKEKPTPLERAALYSARNNLSAALARPFGGIASLPVWRKHSRTGDEEYDPGDTEDIGVSAFAQKLLKKFKYDDGVVEELAATAKQFLIPHVAVIVVPTTAVNAKRHDKLVPYFTCAQLRAYLANTCAKYNVPFMDPGEPSKLYCNFRDAYHLNDTGRQRYTAVVASWYLSQSGDAAQTARAQQIRAQAVQAMNELGLVGPLP